MGWRKYFMGMNSMRRKAKKLSLVAGFVFASGLVIPIGPFSGALGVAETQAAGLLQIIVKSGLARAAAGGVKPVSHETNDEPDTANASNTPSDAERKDGES
jgi:hypothetical protein